MDQYAHYVNSPPDIDTLTTLHVVGITRLIIIYVAKLAGLLNKSKIYLLTMLCTVIKFTLYISLSMYREPEPKGKGFVSCKPV